jgi:RHS repeat-associated protein
LPTAQYTHGTSIDDINIRATATTAQYFHQDGLGSVVGVTNAAGLTDATQRFDAWGNKLTATGIAPRYGYTGREPDETGLVFYRARYYDPSIGRFTQRDPIGLRGGLNRYAYVGGNPVLRVDPKGENQVIIIGGIIFVGSAGAGVVTYFNGGTAGDAFGTFIDTAIGMGVTLVTATAVPETLVGEMASIIFGTATDAALNLKTVGDVISPAHGGTLTPPSNVPIPNNGTTDTSSHGGGATVGGLLGRAVPAAPYSGNQK